MNKLNPNTIIAVAGSLTMAYVVYKVFNSNVSANLSQPNNFVNSGVNHVTGGHVDLHGTGTAIGGYIYELLHGRVNPNGTGSN